MPAHWVGQAPSREAFFDARGGVCAACIVCSKVAAAQSGKHNNRAGVNIVMASPPSFLIKQANDRLTTRRNCGKGECCALAPQTLNPTHLADEFPLRLSDGLH